MCISTLLESILYLLCPSSKKNQFDSESDNECDIYTLYSEYSESRINSSTQNPMFVEEIVYPIQEEITSDLMEMLDEIKSQDRMRVDVEAMQVKLEEHYNSYLNTLSQESIDKIRDFETNILSTEKVKWIGVNFEMKIVYVDTRYEDVISHIFHGLRNGILETTKEKLSRDISECLRYSLSYIPLNGNNIIHSIHYLLYILSLISDEQMSVQEPIVFNFNSIIVVH